MASPLKPSTARGSPYLLHGYIQLELSRHMLRHNARFPYRAHTLRVEAGSWQIHNRHCDKYGLNNVQDKKHVLVLCPCMEMCYLSNSIFPFSVEISRTTY